MNALRRHATNTLCLAIPVAAYALPTSAVLQLIGRARTPGLHLAALLATPAVFILLFTLTCGLLSLPTHGGIVPGKFPRDTGHRIYFRRRIYGTCWTTLFYCKPVYFIVLHLPWLRTLTFRLFGYRGSLRFTVYPDCWLRDLVLLDLGPGAYLSNRCTIGTNICHMNNTITVDRITVGERAIVGHLAMVAHGCRIGLHAEVGVGSGIGINARIGDHAHIGPMCMVDHYAEVGARTRVGARSYIGAGARIAAGLHLPAGALIPPKAIIREQHEVERYVSSASHVPVELQ